MSAEQVSETEKRLIDSGKFGLLDQIQEGLKKGNEENQKNLSSSVADKNTPKKPINKISESRKN